VRTKIQGRWLFFESRFSRDFASFPDPAWMLIDAPVVRARTRQIQQRTLCDTTVLLCHRDRPFRDGEGHEGMTGADIAEVIALLSLILTYVLGYYCWTVQAAREKLSGAELVVITALSLFLTLSPLAYMVRNIKRQRQQRRRLRLEAVDDDAVIFDNPTHNEDGKESES
jgi:hypothetical protein